MSGRLFRFGVDQAVLCSVPGPGNYSAMADLLTPSGWRRVAIPFQVPERPICHELALDLGMARRQSLRGAAGAPDAGVDSLAVPSMIYNCRMGSQCFRVNSPAVIYEQFDGELVAIHLDTGAYHSLLGAAADAFLLLAEEATAAELAEALATKYDASAEQIATALTPFLAALEAEKLIATVEVRHSPQALRLASAGARLPFVPPSLEAYHDLQSLFLLDPVHEVGDQGWPHPPEAASGNGGV